MLFSGFNESVKIDLPAEAEQASAFPLNLLASSEAVPVSLIGNETMLNETMLNETMLNETMLNETMLNETMLNETMLNETMHENNTAQAALIA
jgi:hypothetical protein